MIKKVEGIVISETTYGETSKIINILTKEYGIIGVMAKGAKTLKSKLRAVTSRFTYGYYHIYYKPDKLSILISVDVIDQLKTIRNDILLIGYLNYLTELTTQVFKQSNELSIYDIYKTGLLKINEGLDPLIITNIIELKYLDYLGIGLNLGECISCGSKTNIVTVDADAGGYICENCHHEEKIVDIKTIKMLRMYYLVDLKSITKIAISIQVEQEINNFLACYYERYTGLYLKSKDFLKTISKLSS